MGISRGNVLIPQFAARQWGGPRSQHCAQGWCSRPLRRPRAAPGFVAWGSFPLSRCIGESCELLTIFSNRASQNVWVYGENQGFSHTHLPFVGAVPALLILPWQGLRPVGSWIPGILCCLSNEVDCPCQPEVPCGSACWNAELLLFSPKASSSKILHHFGPLVP